LVIVRDERRYGWQAAEKRERRHAPRRPLLARLMMTQGDLLITAMCRDISIGGMQVLTDKVPGPVGTHLKMNVSSTEGKTDVSVSGRKIEPFVAEGVIVRILEDGRGFSFRFDGLSANAKRAIETYIEGL
jgi:UDP-N-acetylenolpyruvoylglucosamine reductase